MQRFKPLLTCMLIAIVAVAFTPRERRELVVIDTDTVKVTPALDTLPLRTSTLLTARTVDSLGRTVNKPITWTIRDTTAFKPTKAKDIKGKTLTVWAKADTGRTYVVAVQGSKKDSALLIARDTTCSATAVGSINLLPDSAVMRRSDKGGFVAIVRNTCGNVLQHAKVVWSSTDSTKLTVAATPHSAGDSVSATTASLDSVGSPYIRAVLGSVKDSSKVRLATAP